MGFSIYEKTTYKNFEIILVNNRSEETETFELLEKYQKTHQNFRVVDDFFRVRKHGNFIRQRGDFFWNLLRFI